MGKGASRAVRDRGGVDLRWGGQTYLGILIGERVPCIGAGEEKNLVRARTRNRISKRQRQHKGDSKQDAQTNLQWILLDPDQRSGPRKSFSFQPRAKSRRTVLTERSASCPTPESQFPARVRQRPALVVCLLHLTAAGALDPRALGLSLTRIYRSQGSKSGMQLIDADNRKIAFLA